MVLTITAGSTRSKLPIRPGAKFILLLVDVGLYLTLPNRDAQASQCIRGQNCLSRNALLKIPHAPKPLVTWMATFEHHEYMAYLMENSSSYIKSVEEAGRHRTK